MAKRRTDEGRDESTAVPARGSSSGSRRREPTGAAAGRRFATKVFRSGNSDAVRLPRRLGLAGTSVVVRVLDDGRLVVAPAVKRRWPAGFFGGPGATADFEAPARPPADSAAEARAARLFADE